MPELTLPAEGAYSDIERDLIENEPPGLFPEDQNSVWGQVRKAFGDYMQVNFADKLAQWYTNLDPSTTGSEDFEEWEYMLGIPDLSGQTDAARRSFYVSRREQGPFTRSRRNRIIEAFILPTFGTSTAFDPLGIPFDAGGISMLADTVALPSSYRVYEDVRNFVYDVWINSAITPDMAGLTRELKRITPAGITPTLDNAHANILDYLRTVRNLQPLGYWRLANVNDSSGNANNGTAAGGVTVGGIAAPGLLNASIGGTDAATDFDGVDDKITIPTLSLYGLTRRFSMAAWIRPDTLPAAGANFKPIIAESSSGSYLSLTDTGHIQFAAKVDGTQRTVTSAAGAIAATTTYFVVGTYDGMTLRLYINGVLVASASFTGNGVLSAAGLTIANFSTSWFDGRIDDAQVYDRPLSATEVLSLYNTGVNVA